MTSLWDRFDRMDSSYVYIAVAMLLIGFAVIEYTRGKT